MSDPLPEKLYLIDASSYVYRAFFALPELSTSRGFPTNALYGFITMLQKLLRVHAPAYVAAVMDRPEPTFRHTAYPDYKANRAEMPDNLSLQMPHIREVLQAFNVAAVEKTGYEADDVIGTLALQAAAEGAQVVIVSGDKDMCQLVGPRITLLDTMKDRTVDAAAVARTYGLPPDKMTDYFGLTGDSSDNVPGVAGVGPKTAQSLIAEYGSLDGVYQNLERISRKRLQQILDQHRDAAFLSRTLVTIDTAVPLDLHWRDLKAAQPDPEALRRLFKTFEFTRQLKALAVDERPEKNYRVLTDPEEIRRLFADLRDRGAFTLDLETTSEHPMLAEIVGISCAWRDHEAWYIPLRHRDLANQPDPAFVLAELKPLLEDERISKTGHNIKYEYIIFKRCGIEMRGIACDTMVASYVLNPSKYRHNLDAVALDYLDYRTISFKDVAGSGAKAVTFDRVGIEAAADYACEDSDIAGMLARLLMPRIQQEGFQELYCAIEMPLVPVLAEMELAGVRLDLDLLQGLSREFGQKLAGIEARVHDLAGESFNINSPKQLGAVLFEKLGLPARKKTKTGYATDVAVLTELAPEHPLPAEVLAYRSLAKLISTYIDSIPRLVNPVTGRIHTSYNQTVTATGRLSSSDPNLQNIPIRTEEGRRIREAFITEPGWKLLSADYSQIELRILAHLAEDATLIEAFRLDQDIHARTAAEIWDVPAEQVSARMRRDAKVINFGIIYGMSSYGLAQELGIEPSVAQNYIDGYFSRYSGVRLYLDGVLARARRNGYVETLMKRRRYLPDIQAANGTVRKFAERTAINAPIQGTAADLIKIAMITLDKALKAEGLKARMIMQVHDELVFEAPENELETLAALVRRDMEGAFNLRVPLRVDISWGDTWREAH